MTTFVIDASVAASWVLKDEQSPGPSALRDQALEFGCHAPLIWPAEIEQVLLTTEGVGRAMTDDVGEARSLFSDVHVAVDVDLPIANAIRAASLARRHKLSVYDAMYLDLARRLDLPLATLDKRLRAAAEAQGVAVLPA